MVTVQVITREKGSGETVCINESTVVLRGSGGFGGKKVGAGKSTSNSASGCEGIELEMNEGRSDRKRSEK